MGGGLCTVRKCSLCFTPSCILQALFQLQFVNLVKKTGQASGRAEKSSNTGSQLFTKITNKTHAAVFLINYLNCLGLIITLKIST